MDSQPQLSSGANALIEAFDSKSANTDEPKINVNRFVSELASWYERLRNAMDYRHEEVVLRAAVERILKRRHLFGGEGKSIAEPLLRELVWARYFPSNTIPESMSEKIAEIIDLYLLLKNKVFFQHVIPEPILTEWIYQLTSSAITKLVSPNLEKNVMSNFMYHFMKDSIKIEDDTADTKNVQVYLAVRRAYAHDDIAFLRYYLFQQIYPTFSHHTIEHIAQTFKDTYYEINHQLSYPLKEKVFLYVRRQTPTFFILEDVLRKERGGVKKLLDMPEEFAKAVFTACDIRYKNIRSKVNRAIVRSVIFLLLTKVFFAYAIEGTYDNYIYGHIMWMTLALNTGIPPVLMIVVSLFIRTPDQKNSEKILENINSLLYKEKPNISYQLILSLHPKKSKPFLVAIFTLLWIFAFVISFGTIYILLSAMHFNLVSKGIFIFFVTIVSFLSYRINTTAHMYSVGDKQKVYTPFVDFLFLPIIRVGMRFTEGVSKINIFIFIFDFLIEAPFKAIFSFFEQWFSYLHTKREDLE